MIEDWIDTLVEVWRINVGDFKQVKSPYILKADEFPDAISPVDDFPIALTFLANVRPQYSKGNKNITAFPYGPEHLIVKAGGGAKKKATAKKAAKKKR